MVENMPTTTLNHEIIYGPMDGTVLVVQRDRAVSRTAFFTGAQGSKAVHYHD
jgi:hypothetical protein